MVVVALLALLGGRAWMLRRRDARRVARVTAGAADYLRNVLVPDGNGGDYHLDFVLLTSRGVVVIDMRDIIGNVFGGDQMTAWTLMSGPSRTTFVNPQAGLYDRIASVKAIDHRHAGRRPHRVHQAREVSERSAAFHGDARIGRRGISQARRRRARDRRGEISPGLGEAQGSRQAKPAFPLDADRGGLKPLQPLRVHSR